MLTSGAGTTAARTTLLVGGESVGKSTLAAALARVPARDDNVAGSTLTVQRLDAGDHVVVDTPGIVHRADNETTRRTLEALAHDQTPEILLVLRATHLDDELADLLPLVAGRRGAVVVTHWDRVEGRVEDRPAARHALDSVAAATGVPFAPVDARDPGRARAMVGRLLDRPGTFAGGPVLARVGWRIEPPTTVLEHRWLGPPFALAGLLAPAVGSVWLAVRAAGAAESLVETAGSSLADAARRLPWPLADVVAGDYGLVTMGPLLLVWALPVVLVLALLHGVGRASGLLDRLATAVHPLVRPLGLTGRDLVRVVAGYGCNVPAVIATRSCSSCSRDATVGAIAFGSACSFQLGATLGVLAAAQRPSLTVPYLAVLLAGALLHARLLARTQGGPAGLDLHLLRRRAFLVWPRWSAVRREAAGTLRHVSLRALPVFLGVVVVASLLETTGAMRAAARPLGPALAVLRLPEEVALPVILASIRKDGLLLLAEPGTVAQLDGPQLLAGLVLAGALAPCLVTVVTIARERGGRVAGRLLLRQAIGASLLAAAISWVGLAVVGP